MESVVPLLDGFVGDEFWCLKPFSVPIGGSPWSASSDCSWLVAFKGPSALPKLADTDRVGWVRTYLSYPAPEDAKTFDVSYLRTWAGEAPGPGEKYEFEGVRRGVVAGTLLDRRRLAKILSITPEGDVTVWSFNGGEYEIPILAISSGRWRLFLAGVDGEATDEDEVFPFPEKRKSALDAMADLEQE